MLKLGVNVDHVATVRQARLAQLPDPVAAAQDCEAAGAHGITAHLREDRRHIQDDDLRRLVRTIQRVNMEMAATTEMVRIARQLRPAHCCLVPEKRQELTTEGGLDVRRGGTKLAAAVRNLQERGIIVSLFVAPEPEQLQASRDTGAEYVELHTGAYAEATGRARTTELNRLIRGAEQAHRLGLRVNAGHGIDYDNLPGILRVPHLVELNIGHSIIARAIFTGISIAVAEMIDLMREYPD
jgi:pyridoxine 5-phosphate synthase